MANVVFIFKPAREMTVCKSRIVSVLVLCTAYIINTSALQHPQTDHMHLPPVGKIGGELAESCKHMLANSAVKNLSFISDQIDGLSHMHISERLGISEGDFSGERDTLNATGSNDRVHLYAHSVSSTDYMGVYLVNVTMNLVSISYWEKPPGAEETGMTLRRVQMMSDFQGLFSNETGLLCATFCAGTPPEQVKSQRLRQQHSYAPAEFVSKSANPFSENVTTAFVKWDCDVHIELQYPKSNTIATRIVAGVMNSLRPSTDPSFFHPIHIVGNSRHQYEYSPTVFEQAKSWGDAAKDDISPENTLEVWFLYPPFCPDLGKPLKFMSEASIYSFSAVFNSACDYTEGNHCSPFRNYGIGESPVTVAMTRIHCTDGPNWRISADIIFKQTHLLNFGPTEVQYEFPRLNPLTEFLLVAEGYWSNSGQLVMVAHYLGSDGTPVDTKILITLQLPTVRTIHHPYGFFGHIRSMREPGDPLYFKTVSLLGDFQHMFVPSKANSIFQVDYRYDNRVMERIEPTCKLRIKQEFGKHAKFPDGSSPLDFQVSSHLLDSESSSFTPNFLRLTIIAIQDRIQTFSKLYVNAEKHEVDVQPTFRDGSMSFAATLFGANGSSEQRVAEGQYNQETGHLCMLGCRQSPDSIAVSYYEEGPYRRENNSITSDRCDVFFNIQYPPTNPRLWAKRPFVTGNISSLVDPTHPLYFSPLILNSTQRRPFYREQAIQGVLRRHLETILSLSSLSLTTVFVIVQVRYARKQSTIKNLKYVSLVMLMILISGHFIPLLLSFKDIWISVRSRSNYPTIVGFGRGLNSTYGFSWFSAEKWSEAYQVIARGTSMAALLLELRLVRLVWKSRSKVGPNSNLLHGSGHATPPKIVTDTQVLQACLPLYAAVMAVVALVHWHIAPPLQVQQSTHYISQSRGWDMIWTDILGFSGVVLDLFLVPQVIANVLWDTQGKIAPLHPVFYIGITVVRSLAHLFDAWRAQNFISESQQYNLDTYFYANPHWDLYSTTWDILIPCGSILLATLLFLQQKYGGQCFLPKSSQRRSSYELFSNLQL